MPRVVSCLMILIQATRSGWTCRLAIAGCREEETSFLLISFTLFWIRRAHRDGGPNNDWLCESSKLPSSERWSGFRCSRHCGTTDRDGTTTSSRIFSRLGIGRSASIPVSTVVSTYSYVPVTSHPLSITKATCPPTRAPEAHPVYIIHPAYIMVWLRDMSLVVNLCRAEDLAPSFCTDRQVSWKKGVHP
ncbi:hypothetical protein SISSUDRAFT_877419 [Sistotremastrum suecicum HHB10207 ss-3]|uniref:Secreted protein n=1 Tax=Sistotremastrum suecicum HHB10207 ss-3 TaxID=1314776 RepID=A0A166C931_9AGAM|nr:hypothetical protein SISSUDRAFT_877419 [Sistotremastrum suecicum HHB10207 ss-3]